MAKISVLYLESFHCMNPELIIIILFFILTLIANISAGILQNSANQQQTNAKMLAMTAKMRAGVPTFEPLETTAG